MGEFRKKYSSVPAEKHLFQDEVAPDVNPQWTFYPSRCKYDASDSFS
jgi:hypothetical protein